MSEELPADHCKSRGAPFAFRVALGLTVGLLAVVVWTYVVWATGSVIGKWHWLVFPVGYALAGVGMRLRALMLHTGAGMGITLAVWIWSLCCAQLWGLNWDGMLIHKEYVMALQEGWNPVKDPLYSQRIGSDEWEKQASFHKIEWGGYQVRAGHLLQAVLAKATGSVEAGKAVNLLFVLLPFSVAMHVLRLWRKSAVSRYLLAGLIALNPVWILQSISFWEDAQFAGLSVSAILLAMVVSRRVKVAEFVLLVFLIVLLVGSKRSGLGFAGILLFWTLGVACSRLRPTKQNLRYGMFLLCGLMGFCILLLWGPTQLHQKIPYQWDQILKVNDLEYLLGSEAVSKLPRLDSLHGGFQYLAVILSPTSMEMRDSAVQPPFVFGQDELDVYFHIFAAPWFGGFGPWYAEALLLMSLSLLMAPRNRLIATWSSIVPWMLFLMVLLWLMPAIFPRWIPFLWLLPFFCFLWTHAEIEAILPSSGSEAVRLKSRSPERVINLLRGSRFWGYVSWLGMGVLAINVMMLLLLNILGHFRASAVVQEQIEFAHAYLSKPLHVSYAEFPSNRDWLDRKHIAWKRVDGVSERNSSLTLGRTTTRIWFDRDAIDEPFVVGGRTWESLEEWGNALDRRLGRRGDWNAWIPASLQLEAEE